MISHVDDVTGMLETGPCPLLFHLEESSGVEYSKDDNVKKCSGDRERLDGRSSKGCSRRNGTCVAKTSYKVSV